ncbi:hypothetical protein [Geminicoccus flavidas]|uniref:hypothetical protein n=1 Tax=Geminicoccus flavidas TaxID=2506407 RepID=UPI00190F1192|nr:hypothetical protein [Geminicoccus flavidas]
MIGIATLIALVGPFDLANPLLTALDPARHHTGNQRHRNVGIGCLVVADDPGTARPARPPGMRTEGNT